ncbi:MAG: dATP/dGTP diphosphohydrolase domain-containing protein, partial [Crocinitomicaceae bacterium]
SPGLNGLGALLFFFKSVQVWGAFFNTHNVIGSALRYNSNKLRWSLVDFDALEDMVKVLDFGSKKYADNNWKKGLKTTEIFESIMRHLSAYMRGEEFDLESGLPHTGHILCNAMFLSYMEKYKKDFDTRFFDKNKKKCC